MPTETPDFTIVEQTWARRLQEFGLPCQPIPDGIATGYDRFDVYRLETQIAQVSLDDRADPSYLGSLEVKAVLQHPSFGSAEISDRITLQGESLNQTLEQCANTYMDVTFPALRSLFDGRPAPGSTSIKLSSFTPALGRAIQWEVYTAKLQILNDPDGRLAERLGQQPPLALLFDTLTGYLAEPRLHWYKLYGANTPRAGLVFGCSIDGGKSLEAEAEMRHKFREGGSVPGQWEFRQFLVMRPAGEADEETAAQLRKKAAEVFQPRKRK